MTQRLDEAWPDAWEHAYGVGHTHGKDKAYFEVLNHDPDGHGVGCGCRPCKVWRHVLKQTVGITLRPTADSGPKSLISGFSSKSTPSRIDDI